MPDADLIFMMLSQILQTPLVVIAGAIGALFVVLFVYIRLIDLISLG